MQREGKGVKRLFGLPEATSFSFFMYMELVNSLNRDVHIAFLDQQVATGDGDYYSGTVTAVVCWEMVGEGREKRLMRGKHCGGKTGSFEPSGVIMASTRCCDLLLDWLHMYQKQMWIKNQFAESAKHKVQRSTLHSIQPQHPWAVLPVQ